MVLLGRREPTFLFRPNSEASRGQEAIDLAESAGLHLDPWQQDMVRASLGTGDDGKWSAFEVAMVVPRQNGKTAILEAVILAGLFLFDEKLIVYSAHEYKTAKETFLRVQNLINSSDELRDGVKIVRTAHGEEGIELLNGSRLLFLARSRGSGRGFTSDRLIWDEAYELPDHAVEATLPTMSARPNPQVFYASMAPDKDLAPCEPLGRLRTRAHKGGSDSLMFAEWAIDAHDDYCPVTCTAHDEPSDPASWAKSNPALGIRISAGFIAREMDALSRTGFARERLGVGNWPSEDGAGWAVISLETWAELEDPEAAAVEPLAIAADVTPERSYGSIVVSDGITIELTDHRRGTRWMVDRLIELNETWRPRAIVIDAAGPAGTLIKPLEDAGVTVTQPTTREVAQAAGRFYDLAVQRALRHLGDPDLAAAVAGATRRKLSGSWAWSRADTSVDISPLVAATEAVWGIENAPDVGEKSYFLDLDEDAA